MSLERDLATLVEAVDWPPTPDVAGAVTGRLAPRRCPQRRRRVLAVVLVAVAGAAAVPDVRAAVERFLGVAGGERIERVPTAPTPAPRLSLGRAVTLAQARREAGFHVAIPSGGPEPAVRIGGALGDRTVSLLLPGAILSQRPGQAAIFTGKQAGPGVEVRWMTVAGARGVWIGEGPRAIVVMRDDGTQRRWSAALPGAGVLLWDRGGVALRLETRGTVGEALALAESVR